MLAAGFGQAIYKNGGEARLSPRLLNYQGYLTDTLGNPITNPSISMTFAIFDAASAGNQKWTETQNTVSVNKGIFSVLLGSVTPIPDSVFTSSASRWLQLTIAGQALSPRTRIVSAPYAFTSTYSDTSVYARNSAPDNDWTFLVSDGADTTLQMGSQWGLARAGNMLYGNADSTHVNFGVACTTGSAMENNKYCAIGGGYHNKAFAPYATVAGGGSNTASNDFTNVTGGFSNTANGLFAAVNGGERNTSSGSGATVAGGSFNTASGINAAVGGGYSNKASGDFATMGGGFFDTVVAYYGGIFSGRYNKSGDAVTDTAAVICGGNLNTATAKYSFIGGGSNNTTSNVYTTICGGAYNTITGDCAVVAGGYANRAGNVDATVGGGRFHTASGPSSTIGGGYADTASGDYATIAGGSDNNAVSPYASVGGGSGNNAIGWFSSIAGGGLNTSSHNYTSVGGGAFNVASGEYATVTGGGSNTANSRCSSVGGGAGNLASDTAATVAGGSSNWAISRYAFIGGGCNNRANNGYTTVGGGTTNTASGYSAIVSGGWVNSAIGAYGYVGSGKSNLAGDVPEDTGAVVTGGCFHGALSKYSFVGGGYADTAYGNYATVSGGRSNTANGNYATVSGGGNNTASGYSATASGMFNTASGNYATIAGGENNSASGGSSTVGGGIYDTSRADYSFTVGFHSVVPLTYDYSAAFNGQPATASAQTRVGILAKNSGTFTIDHPLDPENKILNHYFVESPEMVLIYRGSAIIGEDGRAVVHLPDYFDALNEAPMIQLTGIKSNVVWVEEKVSGNAFVIGGKPGTEVYWTVTGARKDPSAEITKILMPVEQIKEGGLAGRSLDDDFLVVTKGQLERMGKADGFKFRHASEQKRYEEMKRMIEENENK